MYRPGDAVIFRMSKRSSHPGPRAQEVYAEPRGEDYVYEVDKFWVVADVADDGRLLLRTRRGKEHVVDPESPRLRHPSWWERLIYRGRFPELVRSA